MAPLFQELRPVVATFSALSQAQTVANLPSIGFANNSSTSPDSLGIRPAHLWSVDYVKLLWSDTGAVLTGPAHWDKLDWMYAGFAAAGIGAAASLDNTIKVNVQAHRTAGQDRFWFLGLAYTRKATQSNQSRLLQRALPYPNRPRQNPRPSANFVSHDL